MSLDDRSLLRRLQSGDRNAFVEAAEHFHKEIWAYIYKLSGDRELASDVCQETAITVWRAAPEFKGIKALRAWIYRVAHNLYVSECRKRRVKTLPLEEAVVTEPSRDMMGSIITRDTVRKALLRLPDNVRQAVVLTKSQGLTSSEAAEVLDVPTGTVKWWIAEGLKTLRRYLSEEEGET